MSDMRTIPGFPSYSITKDGRVWSKPRRDKLERQCGNKWITLRLKPNGYCVVDLCKNNKSRTCYVHRLVLETYVGPCPNGMECRHLNGCKTDNHICNLTWGSSAENKADNIKHGTSNLGQQYNQGEGNSRAKLTEQKVRLLYNLYHSGADTQQGLADAFGVGQTVVSEIIRRTKWRHVWATI